MTTPAADQGGHCRDTGASRRMEVTASEQAWVYQAGRDQTVNEYEMVLPAEALRPVDQVAAPTHLVNVPALAHLFVGRDEELAALRQVLPDPEPGQARRPVVVAAVHGLGGIGKSTLAARYAATHAGVFNPVWWITADSPASIEAGLAALATALQPELARAAPSAVLAARAARWLACHDGWLLILDNVTDPGHISDLIGPGLPGRVLVTSRLGQGWHRLNAHLLRLDVLAVDEAMGLLTRIATGDRPNGAVTGPVTDPGAHPGAAIDAGPGTGLDGAAELVAELGCLPLAIEQVGAYLHQNQLTPRAYLDLLAAYPAVMFDQAAEGGDAERTIARIWRITLDQLTTTPLAGELLRILAWYAPERIPRTLLDGIVNEPPLLQQALGRLAAYNMITLDPDGITVHRLVQTLARTPDPRKAAEPCDPGDPHRNLHAILTARTAAVLLLDYAHPQHCDIPASWPRWRELLPHIDALFAHTPPSADTADAYGLLRTTGMFLQGQGAISRALTYLTRCLNLSERLYDPDDPLVLGARASLGYAYRAAGNLGQAIPMYEQGVADSQRVLGVDRPETLISRNNLAYAYELAGEVDRAIALHEQTLADCERVLGVGHPDTLSSRNNLASACYTVGDLGRAIPLFEQTLADRERVLGSSHPDTLTSRSNLANAYQDAGNLTRAFPLLEQTLTDCERVLGSDHPHTLTSRNNLANAYQDAGDLTRAFPLFEQTLADRERVLGSGHPDTLTSRNNLASAYRQAGDLGRAITLHEQTLADREQVLGSSHPDTLASRNNLAGAFRAAGDLSRAIPLYEQNLADCERVLGSTHPRTLASRSNLASAYRAPEDLGRAISLYEQTLADCERVLGADHPTTKIVRSNMAAARRHADADAV
ncbi:tetratricopeptide repeat protein [Herbidospora mongoliensis]|uniref:tetratricopeptide repeat protein n=1 Tax=Herbidospora mongoliensis TaxID=688067 RepID=UPI001C3F1CDC|nr:tetratricopeptide repeat protein [Herbidospora mongoliensis]